MENAKQQNVPASSAEQQANLSARLVASGAEMVPMAFQKELGDWIKTNQKKFDSVIRASNKDEQQKIVRILAASLLYLAKSNAKLLECSITSIGESLFYCAALGLFPGPLQEVALVPFKKEAKVMPTYFGLIKLTYNTGVVRRVSAEVAYENDDFEYALGSDERILHRPLLSGDRGNRLAAYSVLETDNGKFHVVKPISFVEGIRLRSPAVKNGMSSPWDSDYDPMAQKTLVKQVLKLFPKSVVDVRAQREQARLALAVNLDNTIESEEKNIISIDDAIETLGEKS